MNHMPHDAMPLEEVETLSKAKIAPQINNHTLLVKSACNVIATTLHLSFPEQNCPLQKRVATNLLVRMFNELRTVSLLCESGYALTAFSNAAVLYEAGWTVAAIANKLEMAEAWYAHTTLKQWRRIKDLTKLGLENLSPNDASEAKIDELYSFYSEVCLAKHLNPLVQQHEGFIQGVQEIIYEPSPSITHSAILKSWWVMMASVRFAYPALYVYQRHHVLQGNKEQVLGMIKALERQQEDLERTTQAEVEN